MDYEKKYKKLKADIEKAYLFAQTDSTKSVLEHILPELKESRDEKIKGAIIHFISHTPSVPKGVIGKETMLDWLEKQGCQKPFNYECANIPQKDFSPSIGIEIPFGAKDSELQEVTYLIQEGFHAEIKDDKVIIKKGKQKPAEWSKEDDVMVHDILGWLPAKSRPEYNQRRADWLKSLKGRVQPHPKQEWKQENREELTEFENAMMHIGSSFFGENAGLDPNDTDTIKEQAELLLELAPKTEWSEEDKNFMYDTLSNLTELKDRYGEGYGNVGKCIDWLKSIRNRITWKPSDEQMEALWCATEKYLESDNANVVELRGKVLESLYNDLKKLTE